LGSGLLDQKGLFGKLKWLYFDFNVRASSIASATLIGTVVGYSLTPVVINEVNWQFSFYLYGLIGFVWFIWWIYLAADYPEKIEENCIFNYISKEEIEKIRINNKLTETEARFPILSFLSCRHVWAIICTHFSANWGFYILLTWLPSYMKDELHFDLSHAGIVSVLPFLDMFVIKFFSGKLADILISRHILSATAIRKLFQSFSSVFAATFLILIALLKIDTVVIVLFITCASGFQGFEGAGFQANNIDLSPKYAGVIFGISNTFATIPGMVGVILVGFIIKYWSWNAVWIISASVYLFGAIVWNILAFADKKIDFDYIDEKGNRWRYIEDEYLVLN